MNSLNKVQDVIELYPGKAEHVCSNQNKKLIKLFRKSDKVTALDKLSLRMVKQVDTILELMPDRITDCSIEVYPLHSADNTIMEHSIAGEKFIIYSVEFHADKVYNVLMAYHEKGGVIFKVEDESDKN